MNIVTNRQSVENAAPTGTFVVEVLDVEHYTDRLFSFRTARPASFRFRSGEFVMIGILINGKPLFRAYSIASPAWGDELEFFSIKVPDGPLTSHLQGIKPGDALLMRQKPTGTLVNDALEGGRRLYMLSTGTGIAPFASLIREPETYEKFDEVVLCHTCREVAELRYGTELVARIHSDEMLSELLDASRLRHYTTATREPYVRNGRITDLIRSGALFDDLGVTPFNSAQDRAMICGSAEMLRDTKTLLEEAGLVEGSNNRPAQFVIERAFAG